MYILSTSILKINAHKKCPNSCIKINDTNNIKGIKAPINIAINEKIINNGLISKYLNIFFII